MSTNPLPPKRLDPETTAAHLFHLRQTVPLVHCLTNQVVQEITANVLLSAGASPAMIIAKEEVSSFVRIASALLVNVGTLTLEQAEVMHLAVDAVNRAGVPWVLDPVAAGLIPWRDRMINGLLELKPTVIRGNASEIMALAGAGKGGKGVDSTDSSDAALSAAQNLAATRACIVCVTGETDYITDGRTTLYVTGGNRKATLVVGTGCSLSALVAAFIAKTEHPLEAAAAACALAKRAAEQAAGVSSGPGSFRTAYIDALQLLQAKDFY